MRTVPCALALAAVAAVATALWPRGEPVPPDVLWFPLPGGEVGEEPGIASPTWEYGQHWLGPDDSFWEALVVVPRRSALSRFRERLADTLGLAGTDGSGWFYWRCAPRKVDLPAAFAFTGWTEDEAAESQVRHPDTRVLRDRARERIGAARFDALAEGRRDPGLSPR